MTIEIDHAIVFPIAWLKYIYVNLGNNGNLQSEYYKNIDDAVKRSTEDFHPLFIEQLEFAEKKKIAKENEIIHLPISDLHKKKVKKRWVDVDKEGNPLDKKS